MVIVKGTDLNMRISRNADFDYISNGISETNGYIKWYNWNEVKKYTRIINITILTILVVLAFLFRKSLLGTFDIITLAFIMLGSIVFWLIFITPVHEILHLLPLSKGVLDNKCVITVGHGTVSALYNGYVNLYQQLISLILPFSVFFIVLSISAILTTGIARVVLLYLLLLSSYGSYTDIFMFFYCIKHIRKNDIIFGIYKKTEV